MASGGKKKTTMAKLNRERKMRERRLDKQARKEARKLAASLPPDESADPSLAEDATEPDAPEVAQPPRERDLAHSGGR